MSEEREVAPQLLATLQRPDGRLDATYYHADARLPEAFGAPNAINSVKDLDMLLHDLDGYLSLPENQPPRGCGPLHDPHTERTRMVAVHRSWWRLYERPCCDN